MQKIPDRLPEIIERIEALEYRDAKVRVALKELAQKTEHLVDALKALRNAAKDA